MADRAVWQQALNAEEVAAGLQSYLDELPQHSTEIAGIIGDLFGIGSRLRGLDRAEVDPQYHSSLYRIDDDLYRLILPNLVLTLRAIRTMFARTGPYQMVWDDLCHMMDAEGGATLQLRLEWYTSFLDALVEVLNG